MKDPKDTQTPDMFEEETQETPPRDWTPINPEDC